MSNGKTSAEERIAILERRVEESRRTIRALSEMLSRAMDRIEELQNERRRSRRERTTVVYVESPERAPSSDPLFLDTAEVAELLVRVQAVLRRTHRAETEYRIDDLVIRWDAHEVIQNGERVDLTPQEFALLRILIENRNVCLSRQKLLSEAWGIDFLGESRTVDVHVQKLRRKLNLDEHIKTIYKNGYRFEE